MSLIDLLQSYVNFNSDELDTILSYFKVEKYSQGHILVRENQFCHKLYYIQKGIGRSYYLNESGKEITQWFFKEGVFMTSLDSFFQQRPSTYYLELLEDSTIYSIDRIEIDKLFSRYHKMERFGRLISVDMLTRVVDKVNALQFQSSRQRYDYMLTEFPDISYRVPLGHIASYLGMSQETLSRIRRQ